MADVEEQDRPVTYRDFNALVQLFKEERAKADEWRAKAEADKAAEKKERDEEKAKADDWRAKAEADRKERDEERAKAEAKKAKIEKEHADMQKMWEERRMLEYTLIFFKINQGSPPYKQLVHVKAE